MCVVAFFLSPLRQFFFFLPPFCCPRVMDASNKPDGTEAAAGPPAALPTAAVAVQNPPAQLPTAAASSVPLSLPSVVVPALQPPPLAPVTTTTTTTATTTTTIGRATEATTETPLRGEMDIRCFVEAVVEGRASISHTVEPSEIPRSQKKIGLHSSSLAAHLRRVFHCVVAQQERGHQEQCSSV